jgi:hypothetical protein
MGNSFGGGQGARQRLGGNRSVPGTSTTGVSAYDEGPAQRWTSGQYSGAPMTETAAWELVAKTSLRNGSSNEHLERLRELVKNANPGPQLDKAQAHLKYVEQYYAKISSTLVSPQLRALAVIRDGESPEIRVNKEILAALIDVDRPTPATATQIAAALEGLYNEEARRGVRENAAQLLEIKKQQVGVQERALDWAQTQFYLTHGSAEEQALARALNLGIKEYELNEAAAKAWKARQEYSEFVANTGNRLRLQDLGIQLAEQEIEKAKAFVKESAARAAKYGEEGLTEKLKREQLEAMFPFEQERVEAATLASMSSSERDVARAKLYDAERGRLADLLPFERDEARHNVREALAKAVGSELSNVEARTKIMDFWMEKVGNREISVQGALSLMNATQNSLLKSGAITEDNLRTALEEAAAMGQKRREQEEADKVAADMRARETKLAVTSSENKAAGLRNWLNQYGDRLHIGSGPRWDPGIEAIRQTQTRRGLTPMAQRDLAAGAPPAAAWGGLVPGLRDAFQSTLRPPEATPLPGGPAASV